MPPSNTGPDLYELILEITDRAIQEGLEKIHNHDLVRFMIDAPEEVATRILMNLGENAQELLVEDVISVRDHGRVTDGEGGFVLVDNSPESKEQSRLAVFEAMKNTDKIHTQ
jgi:hypothetical protein